MDTISDLRAKAAHFRKVADSIDGTIKLLLEFGGAEKPNGSGDQAPHPLRDLKKFSGVDAIERVLRESDTPLDKDTIAERLSARGKAIGGTTLQSYLSREKKRFASLGRGQWTTAEKKILAEI